MTMNDWNAKGCSVCRKQWAWGRSNPPELAVNAGRHASLHRCQECGTYWEQFERYADVVQESEARKLYPRAFSEANQKRP